MSLFDQLRELHIDLSEDMVDTIMDVDDPKVMAFFGRLVYMGLQNDDIGVVVQQLASSLLWMVVLGREHHARGYPAPVLRGVGDPSQLPDYLLELFEEGDHD